jgi:hypothetical protein
MAQLPNTPRQMPKPFSSAFKSQSYSRRTGCAEQRQRQGGGMPSVEGISATVRAAKAAFLEPLLRAVLVWTATADYAEDQLRDACL